MHRGHNARDYHPHAPAPPERSYGASAQASKMAILAVLEGGPPACRNATHSASPFPTASLPKTIFQLLNPTRPKSPGEPVANLQASASRRESHRRMRTQQGRENGPDGW